MLVALAGIRLLLPEDLPGGVWGLNLVVGVVAVLDGLLATSPRRLEVGRDLPAQIALGAPVVGGWGLRTPPGGAGPVGWASAGAPPWGPPPRPGRVGVLTRREARLATPVRPGRRGRFEPGRVTLRVAGPLGLLARQRTVDVPGQLKVVPAFPSRADAELRLARARRLELGLRTVRLTGTGTDFDQLREYTPDDDFRRIDWAATARSTTPVVRTYRAERNQTVLVLVDVGRTTAGRVADVPRLEHLLDATFALVTVATGVGERVGVIAFDDRVRATVPPSHRGDQLARVVDATYQLEPALIETDFREAFSHALGAHRRRTTFVIATDLNEATVSATLVPALPLVLRDHRVVVAAVADPEVAAWAGAPAGDEASAYRRAAATSALERREGLSARLTGLGATVVDAAPGVLAGRLVDTFLQARGGRPL